MTDESIERVDIPETPDNPARLGRHVLHDPRSRNFPVEPAEAGTLVSKYWQRRAPIFDQGDIGCCTGNAAAGWVVTDNATRLGVPVLNVPVATKSTVVDEKYALDVYGAATHIDRIKGVYPPDDSGSTGLAVAKVLTARKLATQYRHAFGLQAALTALQSGPALLGIEWMEDMFTPSMGGQLHPTGKLAGGHEILLDQIDVHNQRVWICNSWGSDWGMSGRAWMTWHDLDTLLHQNGDVTVPLAA